MMTKTRQAFRNLWGQRGVILLGGMACLFWVGICLESAAAEPCRLSISAMSDVSGGTVLLKDIAALDGNCKALGEVAVSSSPGLGKTRRLSKPRIQQALERAGIDMSTVEIAFPKRIRVRHAAQQVDQSRFFDVLGDLVEEEYGEGAMVRDMKLRGRNLFSKGDLALIPDEGGLDISGRRVRLKVQVLQGHAIVGNMTVSGQLSLQKKIVCASRHLKRGHIITDDDLVMTDKDVAVINGQWHTESGLVFGKQLKMSLRKGAPVLVSQVEVPPVVEKGALVTLRAKNGQLTVETQAQAESSGGVGERIPVTNLSSGKTVLAVIKNARQVEVFF